MTSPRWTNMFHNLTFLLSTGNAWNMLVTANHVLVCSTPFSHGFLQITHHSNWILQVHCLTGIYQRSHICFFFLDLCITDFELTYWPKHILQPVGALNADRLKKFQERYYSFNDTVIPKFHYGSHYSSAGTVGFPITCLRISSSRNCFLAGQFDHFFPILPTSW